MSLWDDIKLDPEKGQQFLSNMGAPLKDLWGAMQTKEGLGNLAKNAWYMGSPMAMAMKMAGDPTGGGVNETLSQITPGVSPAQIPGWMTKALTEGNPSWKVANEMEQRLMDWKGTAYKKFEDAYTDARDMIKNYRKVSRNQKQQWIGNEIKPGAELPLDDAFSLVNEGARYKEPDENVWSLITNEHVDKHPNWITVNQDDAGAPSIALLKDLRPEWKGLGVGRKAYSALADLYGRLRSDATGATSPAARANIWSKIGKPFQDPFVGWGTGRRFETYPVKPPDLAQEQNIYDAARHVLNPARESIKDAKDFEKMLNLYEEAAQGKRTKDNTLEYIKMLADQNKQRPR